ncbi:MAG: endonuclease NucS [Methanotrichaceae archaeon]|nr:endonuclease NucS [Methanotrichaceae archaeon]
MYSDSTTGLTGRQFVCGYGGRIDLLCYDKSRGQYVVIELKLVRAGQNTFGQISGYMGWVQDRIAGNEPVMGLVVSRGVDTKFEAALKTTNRIFPLHVEDLEEDLGFSKGYLDPKIPPRPDGIKLLIPQSPRSKGDLWLRKGDTHSRQGRYAEAWNNKGDALYDQGKYDEAIKAYNKAIELKPNYVAAINSKGFALMEFGKYDEAIKEYDTAIEINPKSVDAWNGKGLVFSTMEKHEEAIRCYDKAVKLNPKNTTSWICKGTALRDQGKYDEAIKAFEKAIDIEIDPQDADAWYNKGLALKALKRDTQANAAFAKAKELGYEGKP